MSHIKVVGDCPRARIPEGSGNEARVIQYWASVGELFRDRSIGEINGQANKFHIVRRTELEGIAGDLMIVAEGTDCPTMDLHHLLLKNTQDTELFLSIIDLLLQQGANNCTNFVVVNVSAHDPGIRRNYTNRLPQSLPILHAKYVSTPTELQMSKGAEEYYLSMINRPCQSETNKIIEYLTRRHSIETHRSKGNYPALDVTAFLLENFPPLFQDFYQIYTIIQALSVPQEYWIYFLENENGKYKVCYSLTYEDKVPIGPSQTDVIETLSQNIVLLRKGELDLAQLFEYQVDSGLLEFIIEFLETKLKYVESVNEYWETIGPNFSVLFTLENGQLVVHFVPTIVPKGANTILGIFHECNERTLTEDEIAKLMQQNYRIRAFLQQQYGTAWTQGDFNIFRYARMFENN